ncbi:CBS domain-containing protein [Methanocella sp. MCL-LM]|uniref:CBS domain-containing protein n=1 Tax=Methanocella sp. MCL-LM TaxID=3412035 RepID=UPI003C747B87
MKVEDVMSVNPVWVSPGEFVTKARELMRDNNIQSLPVVKNGKYAGMITVQDIINVTSTKSDVTIDGYVRLDVPTVTPDTDLATAARKIINTDEGRLPVILDGGRIIGILSIVDMFEGVDDLGLPDLPVSEVMTRKVVVCEPGDLISRVWRNMTEFGIYGFPVVRAGQEVIGMITREDILRRGYVRFQREGEDSQKPPSIVQMVMSTPAVTVTEDDGVKKAAGIFSERGIGRLPVVKNNKLTGIVDRYDILKVCRRLLTVD